MEVEKRNNYNLYRDFFVLGALTIVILYFGLIWLSNKESIRAELYIIMVSILSILYTISNNGMLIRTIFPHIPFKVYNALFYTLPICGTSFYIFMLCHLFEEECFLKIKKITIMKAILFMSVNIFLPIHFIGKIINIANFIAILEFTYGLYVISKVIIKGKEYGISLALGTIALVVSIIYDALYFNGGITKTSGVISPIGLSIYILCYAVSIGRRYEKSYKEIKELSNELLEMDKIKDEFLTNTSHELRTPLNSIITITKSLLEQRETELNVNEKESLSLVVSSGERLKNLINDILDYSRLREGKFILIKSHFDLSKTIDNILKEFEPMIKSKNISILNNIEESLKSIYADKYRMIQVIYNIVGNAVKFTPLNGNIVVTGYEKDNIVTISIKDTGIGIQNDKLDIIFNAFEQGTYSITKKYGGMGLVFQNRL
nr:histidine kinase dimerization/phospho-acceptor domain-containing protein [Marinisporobacter balticus]